MRAAFDTHLIGLRSATRTAAALAPRPLSLKARSLTASRCVTSRVLMGYSIGAQTAGRFPMAPTPAPKPTDIQYAPVSLATVGWPFRLLASDWITATDALPATDELADLVFTESPLEPQNDEAGGFLVWAPRPGTILELWPVLTDAENEDATILFGWMHPMMRQSPSLDTPDPVQWKLAALAAMTITAGAKTGVAGGILDTTAFYADTIAVTKALWPEPNPLRLVGPRTAVDDATLKPDDTPVGVQFDIMGGARAFVYVRRGTAAGVNFLERSF